MLAELDELRMRRAASAIAKKEGGNSAAGEESEEDEEEKVVFFFLSRVEGGQEDRWGRTEHKKILRSDVHTSICVYYRSKCERGSAGLCISFLEGGRGFQGIGREMVRLGEGCTRECVRGHDLGVNLTGGD